MSHFALPEFWYSYRQLSPELRDLADKNFELMKRDPNHPSIRLKKAGPYWSARVGRGHRALARESDDGLVWFWIGPHAEYDRLLKG